MFCEKYEKLTGDIDGYVLGLVNASEYSGIDKSKLHMALQNRVVPDDMVRVAWGGGKPILAIERRALDVLRKVLRLSAWDLRREVFQHENP